MKFLWDNNGTRMTQMLRIIADIIICVNHCFPRHLRSILFLIFLFAYPVFSSDDFPPRANRLVTDYTNTLSSEEQNQLENKLIDFNNTTSTQIAVVIMKSVDGYEINDYAVQLANKWGIGQKGKNNGILILLAMESRDVSIQIGYVLKAHRPMCLPNGLLKTK